MILNIQKTVKNLFRIKSPRTVRFFVPLLLVMLASCAPKGEIKIVSVDGINVKQIGNTGMDIDIIATIDNSFKSKLSVKDASIELLNANRLIAKIDLTEKVTISKSSKEQYIVPLRIRVGQRSLMEVAELLSNHQSWSVRGSVRGCKGIFGKRVRFDQELSTSDVDKISETLTVFIANHPDI